jgi:hypothetical protein
MIRKCLSKAIPGQAGKALPPTPHSGRFFLADSWAHHALTPAYVRTGGFIDKVEAILGQRIENRSCGRPTQAAEQPTEAGAGK